MTNALVLVVMKNGLGIALSSLCLAACASATADVDASADAGADRGQPIARRAAPVQRYGGRNPALPLAGGCLYVGFRSAAAIPSPAGPLIGLGIGGVCLPVAVLVGVVHEVSTQSGLQ